MSILIYAFFRIHVGLQSTDNGLRSTDGGSQSMVHGLLRSAGYT